MQKGDTMQYNHLIFDLYGTLVDIHTDEDAPLVWQKWRCCMGITALVIHRKAFATPI